MQDSLGQRATLAARFSPFVKPIASLGTALLPLKALIIVSLKMAIFSREAFRGAI